MDENSADLTSPYRIFVDIGAFDNEIDDYLTLTMQAPSDGIATLSTQVRSLPDTVSTCDSDTESHGKIPCDLILPDDKVN